MSIVIGIDLGTTNSCVAVPDSAHLRRRREMLDSGQVREVNGVLVILDRFGSPTTPSVVWIDANGQPVVGQLAKQKAIDGEAPPAMFFKRSMGTNQTFPAGHGTLTPQQASTHVLRYLKRLAEDVLRQQVDRAIVTVPAFFENRAKTETTQAGRDAGLDVVETLLEPVAAALAYTRSRGPSERPTQPHTFLVYDLGGGTFDASVVSWDPEVGFDNRAFYGDRYLGGYEFDQAIVGWAGGQLPHHSLRLEPEDPRDARLFARLLVEAESVKKRLTDLPVTAVTFSGDKDREGRPLNVNLPLPRTVFEDIVDERIRETIGLCDQALEKAAIERVDDIVMVGGSSRIPLVARRLRERYEVEPIVFEPDLSVAIGAAIKASSAASRTDYLQLDRPPETTPMTAVDVSGLLVAGDRLPSVSGVTVRLTSDDGALALEERSDADGNILFTDVPLRPDSLNELAIRVIADRQEIDVQRVAITQTAEAPEVVGKPDGDILALDIAVRLQSGRLVVARAGTKLPYETHVSLETANQGTRLQVGLVENHTEIGRVEVADLPADLPIGTAVDVLLEFQRGWTISAEARVRLVNAVGNADIDIPQVILPSWDDLRRRYRQVQMGWKEKSGVAPASQVMRVGPTLERLLRDVESQINQPVDKAKAHHKLGEAETLLESLTVVSKGMHPPWEEFEQLLGELRGLAERLGARDEARARHYLDGIPGLRAAGQRAFDASHRLDWSNANEAVKRQIGAVRNEVDPPGSHELPPLPDLKVAVLSELQEILAAIDRIDRATNRVGGAEAGSLVAEASAISGAVESIEPDDPAGTARLVGIYQRRLMPLRARVERWTDRLQGDGADMIDLRLPKTSL